MANDDMAIFFLKFVMMSKKKNKKTKENINCEKYEHSLDFLVKIENMYIVTNYSKFSKMYYNKHLNPIAAKNAAPG